MTLSSPITTSVNEIAATASSTAMSTNDILTLIAMLMGPIIGALFVVLLEEYRNQKARKMEIFVTLMRTRGMGLSFEHVNALNLIEVEFHKNADVIDAWKKYLDELSKPPLIGNDPVAQNNRYQDRRKSLSVLLHRISKVLKFKIDQFDIFENNYTPQGWHDEDQQQKYLRALLINLLSGRNSMPVYIKEPEESNNFVSPFPPRPDNNNQ